MASRSVRKIWIAFVAVLVAAFLLYFISSRTEYSGNSDVSYSPNILLDSTLYWYVTAYPLSEMPEGLTSIGKVSKNISGISTEDFIETGAASGIGIGAEVFAGNNYPYQLYIQWRDNLSFFTIEPLSFPLIRNQQVRCSSHPTSSTGRPGNGCFRGVLLCKKFLF